ncbi:MAG TPA: glycosyltransferase family 39 protein [Vicinamibacterales bacterium]|nr:glycosyltransferase family 39 protein [Vicinamibacterales bacterium]
MTAVLRVSVVVAGAVAMGAATTIDGATWLEWALAASSHGVLPDTTRLAIADMPRVLAVSGVLLIAGAAFMPAIVHASVAFMREASAGRFAAVVVGASMVLRLLYALSIDNAPVADWEAYDRLARSLINGTGYAEDGRLSAYRPPGYPIFLAGIYAVFGPHAGAAKIANVLLGSATVYLIYLVGRAWFDDHAARCAAILTAIFPTQIYFTALLASEVLFTLLFCLSLWLMRPSFPSQPGKGLPGQLLGAGVVLGLSALVRPVTLLFPLLLAGVGTAQLMLGRRRAGELAGAVAVISLGVAIAIAPWLIRNQMVFGEPIAISTSGAENFWIGAHAGADGSGTPAVPYDEVVAKHGGDPAAGYVEGWRFVRQHPTEYLWLAAKKTHRLLGSGNYGVNWEIGLDPLRPLRPSARILLGMAAHWYYVGVGLLALLIVWLEPRSMPAWFGVAIICYWIAFHALFFGQPRFHFPLEPVLALLAGVSLRALGRRQPFHGMIRSAATAA